jgi:hypothetical protein
MSSRFTGGGEARGIEGGGCERRRLEGDRRLKHEARFELRFNWVMVCYAKHGRKR